MNYDFVIWFNDCCDCFGFLALLLVDCVVYLLLIRLCVGLGCYLFLICLFVACLLSRCYNSSLLGCFFNAFDVCFAFLIV